MSPFASRDLVTHLGRGAGAALLLALVAWLLSAPDGLGGAAAAAAAGAVVLLRGCPMCWLVGLIETIAKLNPKGTRP